MFLCFLVMETRKLTRITMKRILLVLNCILLSIGNCGAPLMLRLYFIHGGQRIWLSSWLQTGGWPIISIPLAIAYFRRRKSCSSDATTKLFYMKPALFIASTIIGILTGVDNYFYAYGLARLPVSTSSLIIATQLAFTAGFAFLLVKQKFTSYTINAIFLLTAGAGVLAMHTSGDKPGNESNRLYILGYIFTLTAAALYGFILPLVELAYKKCMQEINYTLVLEIQMILCLFATVFCTVGSLVNKDFQAIPREARNFGLGEANYYTVLVFIAIIAQCFFLGSIGVIFCASSLLSGVIIAVGLPVTEILAVLFFKEKFRPEKGLALALSLWGFLSYFYGEVKEHKKKNPASDTEMAQIPNPVGNV